MKPLIDRLSGMALFVFSPMLFFIRKKSAGKVIVFFITIIFLSGCFQHYFRTQTQRSADEATLKLLQNSNKYFIIHFGDNKIFGLNNLSVSNGTLDGTPVELPSEHSKYLNPKTDRTNRVTKADKAETLLEVHLYTTNSLSDSNHLSLPLSSFNRIDVYTFDAKATKTNHILSVVGIVVTVGAVAATIAAIAAVSAVSSCNCPQVYVNNNGNYQFVSGVYSGAVYSSLERNDYLPLCNLHATGNLFNIKIRNVDNEEQFINRMQLLQVNHPDGSNVLVDRHGNIFSYDKLEAPVSAIINKHTDITKQLSLMDNDQYAFNSEKEKKGFSNVILTFNRPSGAQKAKLVIHGGNSFWSGYLYHGFADLFGTAYEKWRNEKDKSDPKEMEQWQLDQALPLMAYIEKNGKWEFVDYFAHTGNTASRDMIMELDVSKFRDEPIIIKLETVYQFWNLDYTAIDFSENKKMNTVLIDPTGAIKTDGSSQTGLLDLLDNVDHQYCHLSSNEEMDIEYKPSLAKNGISSYFFVSTGYYHNIKKYEGKPQIAALSKFKNKGMFDEFSRQKFEELQRTLAKVSSK